MQALKMLIEGKNSDFFNRLVLILSILVKISINDKFGKTVSNAKFLLHLQTLHYYPFDYIIVRLKRLY